MKTNKILTFLIVLFLGSIGCTQPAAAQTAEHVKEQKEIIKNRKAMSKLTQKQVSDNVWKQSKKLVKEWKKEGWKSAPGAPSLEQQMNDALMYQYELDGDEPRYIIGRSSGMHSTFDKAKKRAENNAKVDIAGSIKTEVTELLEYSEMSSGMSASDMENVDKVITTGQQFIQQSIENTKTPFVAYREKNGMVEVMVNVAYEWRAAKSSVLELFDKESGELRQKMEKLLGKDAE